MRAARFTGPRRLELVDVPRPEPGPGQVLLKVRATGICGTDLHWYRGEWEPVRVTPGHEIGALVEQVGPGVAGLERGRPVCVEPLVRCGECAPCRAGAYNQCERFTLIGGAVDGGLAEYVLVPAYAAVPLPPAVSAENGSLVEQVAVALHALRTAAPTPGRRALVIGAGPIGLVTTFVASELGLDVTTTTRYPHQVAAARVLGAMEVLDAAHAPPDGGFDLVLDTLGLASTLASAVAACRPRGTLVVMASVAERVELELTRIFMKGLHLLGSVCYCDHEGEPDFQRAVALVAAHPELPTVLVTHRLPLERVGEAFALANDRSSGSIKVLVEP